ncbi:MAG TPA: hypothetical protein VGE72_26310 [Azospirillum sp.]
MTKIHSSLNDKNATDGCNMVLTNDDMTAALYAYDFALGRMGELVALELAAETLRARHQGLDKTAAEAEALRLIQSTRSLSKRTVCATALA